MTYAFVEGDSGSKIIVTCLDSEDGSVKDITDFTVRIKFKVNDGTLVNKAMTKLLPYTDGRAEYLFLDTELATPVTGGDGRIVGEFMLVDGGSNEVTSLTKFVAPVRPRLA